MNKLNDERKKNLESALFEKGATKKFLSDINDVQELIFLINLLNERSDKNVGFNIQDSSESIYKHLIGKLSELSECFFIADASTGGLLIKDNYADLFTCRQFAEDAVKRYSNMGVKCSVFDSSDYKGNIFEYLYYLGVQYLMIDCTENTYSIAVKRNDILSNSKIRKSAECDIDNPSLRFSISNFYCSLNHKESFGIDDKKLNNLQNLMIYYTANAQYIVPSKRDSEDSSKLIMAKTVLENQGELLTVFTDKPEFDKSYSDEWEYIVLGLEHVLQSAVAGNCNGIVINPSSERLSLDRATISHIIKTAKTMTFKA